MEVFSTETPHLGHTVSLGCARRVEMSRKIVVMVAAVLAMMTLWAGVAGAQVSPPSVQATEATVQAVEIEKPLARTGTNAMPEIYVGIGLAAHPQDIAASAFLNLMEREGGEFTGPEPGTCQGR